VISELRDVPIPLLLGDLAVPEAIATPEYSPDIPSPPMSLQPSAAKAIAATPAVQVAASEPVADVTRRNPQIPTIPDPKPIPPSPIITEPSPEVSPSPPQRSSSQLCPGDAQGENQQLPSTITPKKFEFIKGIIQVESSKGQGIALSEKEIKRFKLKEFREKLNQDKLNKPQTLEELVAIAAQVAKIYADQKYSTTGAVICLRKTTQADGIITIRVVEGFLGDIDVKLVRSENDKPPQSPKPLSRAPLEAHIKSRLGANQTRPLNVERLQETLQLLQLDSGQLIKSVTGQLSTGSMPGESILKVDVVPADRTFSAVVSADNSRVPSVGSFQRRMLLREANLLGFGDALSVGYSNSQGSNSSDINYTLPISPHNTTLSATYSRSRSQVVEAPFDDIDGDGKTGDIRSAASTYELTLRHPLLRRIINAESKGNAQRRSVFRELAIGLTGSFRESNTTLLDIPFPLSPGADDEGFTRSFALRFFQEFTQQDGREVLFLRSQFSLGLDALGATISPPLPGLAARTPDSRFVSWLGQAQWIRRLGKNPLRSPQLALRATMQLADRPLLSSEQISIGGMGSVRGYRQDLLQADGGLFGTAELQIPVASLGSKQSGLIQLVPFLDYGLGWNSFGKAPNPNSLLSTGLGVQLRSERLIARLDWGIPLSSVKSNGSTRQDNGIHFSLQWSL
jgi:hemolysin activation/secretion protein